MPDRDHLFINYAYEQEDLALWLALRLTAAGYRVWLDQLKLLGGEPFPTDIDSAIQHRTFRMLSLLSTDSMEKPNPRGERALATNVGKELGINDFILPLKAGPFKASELPFQLSDRNYINFSDSWAEGFRRLLKKLDNIGAPHGFESGPAAVVSWYEASTPVSKSREALWTNLLLFSELPTTMYRVQAGDTEALQWPDGWPRVGQGVADYVFEVPQFAGPPPVVTPYLWLEGDPTAPELKLQPWGASLLRQYVLRRLRELGMHVLPDGSAYFPPGLLPNNRLKFLGYKGKATTCLAVTNRSFPLLNDRREHLRYHLVVRPHVDLRYSIGEPCVSLNVGLYLTYLGGAAVEARKAHSRRRRICRSWYNHEWLNRLLGVTSFFADGQALVNLAAGSSIRIELEGRPHQIIAPFGIDERLLKRGESIIPFELDEDDEDVEGAQGA